MEFISDRLKDKPKFLEMISSKIRDYIISKDNFRQLVCDSVKLDLSNDFKKMQAHIDELERIYATLQVTVNIPKHQAQNLQATIDSLLEQNFNLSAALERQQQYSRRNCLLIHGIGPSAKENTNEKARHFFKTILALP